MTRLPDDIRSLLIELVEKVGLLRRDLQHKGDLERYEARVARITQKLAALATGLQASDPELAAAMKTAWALPARTLAFRNVEHQKQDEQGKSQTPNPNSQGKGQNPEDDD